MLEICAYFGLLSFFSVAMSIPVDDDAPLTSSTSPRDPDTKQYIDPDTTFSPGRNIVNQTQPLVTMPTKNEL